MKLSVQSLIDDLDEHDERPPPPVTKEPATDTPSLAEQRVLPHVGTGAEAAGTPEPAPARRAAAPVLCIAGRGVLDEAACAMLAQLLDRQGLGVRAVPYAATSRVAIGALDVDGVAMVCISYLELSGSPSHLRYLVRRLRQRLPKGIPILVGLWPDGGEVWQDERLRAAVQADHYAGSMREAVDICCKEAHEAGAAGPLLPTPSGQHPEVPAPRPVRSEAAADTG